MIKPNIYDSKVNMLIRSMNLPENDVTAMFSVGLYDDEISCFVQSFRFIVSNDDSTPNCQIFCVAPKSSLTLLSSIFETSSTVNKMNSQKMIHSIFNCEGRLIIDSCNFSDFSFNNVPLIKGKQVAFYSCSFENIERNEGNGAVSEINGSSLVITRCRFNNCKCQNGDGGAIYANLNNCVTTLQQTRVDFLLEKRKNEIFNKEEESLVIKRNSKNSFIRVFESEDINHYENRNNKYELKIEYSTFTNCNAEYGRAIFLNIDGVSSDIEIKKILFNSEDNNINSFFDDQIFIVSDSLDKIINKKNFQFLEDLNKDSSLALGSYDNSYKNEERHIKNLVGLLSKSGYSSIAYVGDNGKDDSSCIDETNACKTLSNVVDKFQDSATNIIVIGNLTIQDEEIGLQYFGYCIQGKNDQSAIIAGKNSSLCINAQTSIENINVIISNSYCSFENKSFFNANHDNDLVFSNVTISSESESTKIDSGLINMVDGNLYIIQSIFKGITINEEGDNSLIRGYSGHFFLNNTSFESCSHKNGEGGGLYLEPNGRYTVIGGNGTTTLFSGCSAERGGGIYIEADYAHSFILTDLTFQNNVASNGKNIFLCCYYIDSLSFYLFPTLLKEVEGGNLFEGFRGELSDDQTIYDLVKLVKGGYKEGPGMLYVGDEGIGSGCDGKTSDKMCNNLDTALGKVKFDRINITVIKSLKTSGGIIIGAGFNMKGENANVKITLDNFVCFDINTDANISSLNFVLNSNNEYSIIHCYSGSLTISSVTFAPESGIAQMDNSVISFDSYGSILIENCSITNIVLSTFNGGAIRAFISEGNKLEIKGTDFINCSVLNGSGGAVSVYLEEDASLSIGDGGKKNTFKGCQASKSNNLYGVILNEEDESNYDYGCGGALYINIEKGAGKVITKNSIFGEGEEENKANYGSNVFVYAEDLLSSINREDFAVISDEVAQKGMVGYEKGMDEPVLLSSLFSDPLSIVYVSSSGSSSKACGKETDPCNSINIALLRGSIDLKNISIIDNITNNEIVNLESKCEISSKKEVVNVDAEKGCSFVVKANSTFNNLSFSLTTISSSIIIVFNEYLILNSINFAPLDISAYITLSSPLISIIQKGNAILSLCSINGITINGGNGAAINADLSNTSLTIQGSSIINCKVIKGNGGGLYVNIGDEGKLIFGKKDRKSNVFNRCSSKKEESEKKNNKVLNQNQDVVYGRGGAVYLKVGEKPGKIRLSNIEMGKEEDANEADEGYDLFVEAKNLKDIVNSDNFPFLEDMDDDYEGAMGMQEGEEPEYLTEAVKEDAKKKKKSRWWIALIVIFLIGIIAAVIIIIVVYLVKVKKIGWKYLKAKDDQASKEAKVDEKGEEYESSGNLDTSLLDDGEKS